MQSADNLIFIFGSSRSGTTWAGKIFDSHPDVLYRHEPDIGLRAEHMPFICNAHEPFIEEARNYLSELVNVRDVKTVGTQPVFERAYRNSVLHELRKAYISFLKTGGRGLPMLNRWVIPDFTGSASLRVVIKSVSALGRTALYADAAPDSRIIHIIRHPCGHVASVLRGQELGKLTTIPLGFCEADTAAEYGLTVEKLEAMSVAERAAWRWVVMNHKAMRDTEGNARVMRLRYEDLCAAPIDVSKQLMEFTGLSWEPEIETFLLSSTSSEGPETFFGVYRYPLEAANKWQEQLAPEQIETIMDIVKDTPPGQLFA